jgi:hypothetical protein
MRHPPSWIGPNGVQVPDGATTLYWLVNSDLEGESMDSLMDRFTEEAEAAGLTARNTNRRATPLPVAMRGATSAHTPPPGVTHLGREQAGPLPLEGVVRAGIGPEEVGDSRSAHVVCGSGRGSGPSSVILLDSDGGCGCGSGAPAAVPARTIGGVANSALVT